MGRQTGERGGQHNRRVSRWRERKRERGTGGHFSSRTAQSNLSLGVRAAGSPANKTRNWRLLLRVDPKRLDPTAPGANGTRGSGPSGGGRGVGGRQANNMRGGEVFHRARAGVRGMLAHSAGRAGAGRHAVASNDNVGGQTRARTGTLAYPLDAATQTTTLTTRRLRRSRGWRMKKPPQKMPTQS